MPIQVLMPALSPTMTEGKLAKWAKKEGDAIKAGDVIATLEAMKMEMALHAPRDGVVKEVLVNAGQSVDAKDLMVVLE